MSNELLLICSVLIIFGSVILWYYWFDTNGLYCFMVFATIAANIEVMVLVSAFGMEQTLGNIMFASTFLITDILSEVAGKEKSKKAVKVGIVTSILFIIVSQLWLMYTPSANDIVFESMKGVFSHTPRIMLAGLLVYVMVQYLDVCLYHKWWGWTTKKWGDSKRFLWLRNNLSTLVSQLCNAVLFTLGAFAGIYEMQTLVEIMISSYLIFIFTSLLDTPFLYLARAIKEKREKSQLN